jgi:hypothetical protein
VPETGLKHANRGWSGGSRLRHRGLKTLDLDEMLTVMSTSARPGRYGADGKAVNTCTGVLPPEKRDPRVGAGDFVECAVASTAERSQTPGGEVSVGCA